jgi:hypothetical protein
MTKEADRIPRPLMSQQDRSTIDSRAAKHSDVKEKVPYDRKHPTSFPKMPNVSCGNSRPSDSLGAASFFHRNNHPPLKKL